MVQVRMRFADPPPHVLLHSPHSPHELHFPSTCDRSKYQRFLECHSVSFEHHRGQRGFPFSVWAHFLSGAIAQKVSLGIFIQHFNWPHLNHYILPYWLSVHLSLHLPQIIILISTMQLPSSLLAQLVAQR